MERTEVHLVAFFVVHFVLRQQERLIHIGATHQFTQGLDVFNVKVLVHERQRHSDGLAHHLTQHLQPEPFDAQPAATPVLTIPDEVDVAIVTNRGIHSDTLDSALVPCDNKSQGVLKLGLLSRAEKLQPPSTGLLLTTLPYSHATPKKATATAAQATMRPKISLISNRMTCPVAMTRPTIPSMR